MTADAGFVAVGRITRAHGVRGEVAVVPLSQVSERYEPGSTLLAGPDHRPVTVTSARRHRNRVLVSFDAITDRTAAEELAGSYLFVTEANVPDAPEGEFWPHELIGCRVWTTAGRDVGSIVEVVRGTANDLWVARDERGDELLIPALRGVVRQVEIGARRIVVEEVRGLTVPDESDDRARTVSGDGT